jgi:ribonuclease HI
MIEKINKKQLFLQDKYKLSLSTIYNEETLNIFSDASFIPGMISDKKALGSHHITGFGKGCYCVLAVCGDNIIEKECVISSNSTVNASELKGIRKALSIANSYKHQYKRINIFSDSLYSVNLVKKNVISTYGRVDLVEANRSILLQIDYIFIELLKYPRCLVTLYHNSGHMNCKNLDNMITMSTKFQKFNNLPYKIDLNLVRYVAKYNCLVDNISREYLMCHQDVDCEDPVEFIIPRKKENKNV